MRSFCLLAWLLLPLIQATPVHWTLAPTTLSTYTHPGLSGLVSGDFYYDAQTNVYSAWSFTVSGLSSPGDGLNAILTPGNSQAVGAYGYEFNLHYTPALHLLHLDFSSFSSSLAGGPLTDAGGIIGTSVQVSTILPSFGSFGVYGSSVVTGQPPDNLVPEPAAGVLVLLGAVALCFWKRR